MRNVPAAWMASSSQSTVTLAALIFVLTVLPGVTVAVIPNVEQSSAGVTFPRKRVFVTKEGVRPSGVANPSREILVVPSPVSGEAPAGNDYPYHTPFSPVGINSHNAPVLNNPIAIYVAWVGTFSAARKQILRNLVASFNPQPDVSVTVDDWWNTSTLYYGGSFDGSTPSGGWLTSTLNLAGELEVSPSTLSSWGIRGTVLSDDDVTTILRKSISLAGWPKLSTAMYFVYTSEAYSQGSSCSSYCGWHNFATLGGVNVAYSWVGVLKCSGCIPEVVRNQPGIDAGMHGSVSVFAHELTEAASNPWLNSWFDSEGEENADKCAWQFGTNTFPNMYGIGGIPFYIQMNWDPQQGLCSLGLSTVSPSTKPLPTVGHLPSLVVM